MFLRKLCALSGFAFVGAVAIVLASAARQSSESINRGLTPPARQDGPVASGWIDDPDAVREAVALMRCGRFCDTAAFAAERDRPEDVYLWEHCRVATGDVLPPRDQKQVGSCVGVATATAVEHLLCVQVADGSGEEFRELASEVIYGGSRVEVGGGRVRGDGSVGAWAAKFVKDYGVVPRGVYGKHDLRTYSERLCRDFGRSGVPEVIEAVAKEHPVKGVANVTTWDECRAAIRNGYPVLVCSSQGFEFERDSEGFCAPRGTWYHAMAVVGVRGGKRPGGFLLNSWGPYVHKGPRVPDDAPVAGFWVDAATLDRMLRQGDSWAFSNATGFPAREK
jgi:hypothetical protein